MTSAWDIAVVAENWERPMAWATALALADDLPAGGAIRVPSFLGPAPRDFPVPVSFIDLGTGFVDRSTVLEALGSIDDVPMLWVWPGTFPANHAIDAGHWRGWRGAVPPPRLAARLAAPVHAPPSIPGHLRRFHGDIEIIRVDCGFGWFDGLQACAADGPIWTQYGDHAPVFVYNTNHFDEATPAAAQIYAILGSGLLGLKLVLESLPPNDAELFIYDINPNQLLWCKYVIDNSDRFETLEAIADAFKADNPAVSIRAVAPHEQSNAQAQRRWFSENRHRIRLLAELNPTFLEVNLLVDPGKLLRRLTPGRTTFFMYLDLFTSWHVTGPSPWIADLPDMATALEIHIMSLLGQKVSFCPNSRSERIQLHSGIFNSSYGE